jgi:hypothetical protein
VAIEAHWQNSTARRESRLGRGRPLGQEEMERGRQNLAQQTQPACEKAAEKEGEKEAEKEVGEVADEVASDGLKAEERPAALR